MFFTKPRHENYNRQNNEKSVSSFIPYLCHWNSNTILTKNHELVSVIKVKGFSFETADDEDLDNKKDTTRSGKIYKI